MQQETKERHECTDRRHEHDVGKGGAVAHDQHLSRGISFQLLPKAQNLHVHQPAPTRLFRLSFRGKGLKLGFGIR